MQNANRSFPNKMWNPNLFIFAPKNVNQTMKNTTEVDVLSIHNHSGRETVEQVKNVFN